METLSGLTNAGQLINLSMDGQAGAQGLLFGREIEGALEEATGIRETLRSVPIRDIGDVHRVVHLDLKANDRLKTAILLSDALVGIELAEINALASGQDYLNWLHFQTMQSMGIFTA